MSLLDRITIDPDICHGQPSIHGTKYTVETLIEYLGSGMGIDEILAHHQDLERDDILAVLVFASRLSRLQHTEPLLA